MRSKSNVMVLDVSDDDPSTTFGITNVMMNLLKYAPTVSPCGEVRKKCVVFGDQRLVEMARKAVSSRTEEKADQRLNCLVPQPQDFHAQKVFLPFLS